MTNNLKAERTLTAFDAWFNEQEGYSLRYERFEGDVEWLKAAFEAGALSTQQPMGEPVAWQYGDRWDMPVSVDFAWWSETRIAEYRAKWDCVRPLYALHPNQESGE